MIIFALLFSLCSIELNAQNIKITYDYSSFSGYLEYEPILLISEKKSQFYVDYDSFVINKNGRKLEFHGQTYAINYEYTTKMFTELRYLDDYEVIASWTNQHKWKILDDTKTILGYKVRKAKTKSGNQILYAWFTTEIPVKTGPFRHAGLPGLILEFYYSIENSKCIIKNIEFNVDKKLKDFSEGFEISRAELKNLKSNKKAIKKRIKRSN